MSSITHFSHQHPLSRSQLVKLDVYSCKLCEKHLLSEVIYCCGRCENFKVHRSCAELPLQQRHSFHPNHTLTLRELSRAKKCNLCADYFRGYGYQCSKCEFFLELSCAALTPSNNHRCLGPWVNHQHSLIACDKPKDNKYSCYFCRHPFGNVQTIYFCMECYCLMHESCSNIPKEIKNPFHLQHSLTFLPRTTVYNHCSLCFGELLASFHCSSCEFYVDIDCAKLVPIIKDHDHLDHDYVEIQPISHRHPLIQCDSIKNFKHKCSGCGLPFEDSIYACLQCPTLLHKSCASMPNEVIHSFHPQHSLYIIDRNLNPKYLSVFYMACHHIPNSLLFMCQECDFVLDIKCATAKLPIIGPDIHQHALAYFNHKTRIGFSCNICHKHSDNSEYFFRCVECNYNIHAYCHPSLPKTIKHDCHLHPLTLTTSPVKDMPDEDEEAEFYCNACEEKRNLDDPTYYCEACHFVAHVHCVFSEILPHLQNKHAGLAGKVNNLQLETSMTVVSGDKVTKGGDSKAIETEEVRQADTRMDIIPQSTATTEDIKTEKKDTIHKLNEDIAIFEKETDALQREIDELTAKLDGLKEKHLHRYAILQTKLLRRDFISAS